MDDQPPRRQKRRAREDTTNRSGEIGISLITVAEIYESAYHFANPQAHIEKFHIPPDLVVKSQAVDSTEVI